MAAFSSAQFPAIPGLDLFLRSGSTGVSLFLVLSGFCLFLPFAGGRIARFKAGEFFRRRCKRLLPAYYVALLLALIAAALTAGKWGLPDLSPGEATWQTVTHVALIHTLFPSTFYALNGAFWSLGLEWQLYLALPLLIWIIARFGLASALALAVMCNVIYRLALGVAIHAGLLDSSSLLAISVIPNQLPGRWAEFALGMLAAELYASGRLLRWARFVPVMVAMMLVLVPTSLVVAQYELGHIVYGALFFTVLCTVLVSDNRIARVLGWRPLALLGTMSYSLYLVHQPMIQLFASWLQVDRPDLTPTLVFVALIALFPVVLLAAWLLFILVERRTIGPNAGETLVPHVLESWFPGAEKLSNVVDWRGLKVTRRTAGPRAR
jgi:peptidoglycan/LPS O-acetylase OafA/YrhL